jgi:membrane protein
MADQPQPEGEEAPSPPPSPPRRSISARPRAVFAAVRDYLSPTEPQPHAAGARRIWLIIAYTFRRWLIEDRATALAASLSLQTLLSVVPVAGLLLTGIGLLGEGRSQAVFEDISRLLIPDPERAHRITEAILGLAHNISVERLGVWGFLSALVVASLVFTTLEKTVNRIWRVTRQRSTVSRFTMFYTLATLGPLIVFYSLAQPVFAAIDRMSLAFTPILTTSVGLILLNRFMPATSVRWRPALIGGLGSAVLFEIGKRGFAAYISVIANYESVYGSLALLPVFMIWTYCSWLLILLGVELAHVAQHINVVAHDGYVHASARSGAHGDIGAGRIAARIMLAICDHFDRHHAGSTIPQLEARYQIGFTRIAGILERLAAAGFLIETSAEETSLIPARPFDQIKVSDLLALFEGGDVPGLRQGDPLTELFLRRDAQDAALLGGLTFQDLILRARRDRQRPGP